MALKALKPIIINQYMADKKSLLIQILKKFLNLLREIVSLPCHLSKKHVELNAELRPIPISLIKPFRRLDLRNKSHN